MEILRQKRELRHRFWLGKKQSEHFRYLRYRQQFRASDGFLLEVKTISLTKLNGNREHHVLGIFSRETIHLPTMRFKAI